LVSGLHFSEKVVDEALFVLAKLVPTDSINASDFGWILNCVMFRTACFLGGKLLFLPPFLKPEPDHRAAAVFQQPVLVSNIYRLLNKPIGGYIQDTSPVGKARLWHLLELSGFVTGGDTDLITSLNHTVHEFLPDFEKLNAFMINRNLRDSYRKQGFRYEYRLAYHLLSRVLVSLLEAGHLLHPSSDNATYKTQSTPYVNVMVNSIPKRVLQKIEYERYLLHVLSPGFYDEAASALVTHSEIHRLISMLNANRAPHNASRHACLFRELHRLLIKQCPNGTTNSGDPTPSSPMPPVDSLGRSLCVTLYRLLKTQIPEAPESPSAQVLRACTTLSSYTAVASHLVASTPLMTQHFTTHAVEVALECLECNRHLIPRVNYAKCSSVYTISPCSNGVTLPNLQPKPGLAPVKCDKCSQNQHGLELCLGYGGNKIHVADSQLLLLCASSYTANPNEPGMPLTSLEGRSINTDIGIYTYVGAALLNQNGVTAILLPNVRKSHL